MDFLPLPLETAKAVAREAKLIVQCLPSIFTSPHAVHSSINPFPYNGHQGVELASPQGLGMVVR